MEAHKEWMESPERLRAKKDSEKKTKAQENLKRKAYELRQKLACAKFVYQKIDHAWDSWDELDGDEQALWWAYHYGYLQKEVDDANEEYGHSLKTRYRGGSAHVGEIMQKVLSLQRDPWQALSF